MNDFLKSKHWLFFFFLGLFANLVCTGQSITKSKEYIKVLCSNEMAGRGYIQNGVNKAAEYLAQHMEALKLRPFTKNGFLQPYYFDIVTHAAPALLKLDNQPLQQGIDYLIDCASPSISGSYHLIHFNPSDTLDRLLLNKKVSKGFKHNEALVFHKSSKRRNEYIDSLKKQNKLPQLIIFTEEKKMTHSLSQKVEEFASVIVMDSVLKQKEILEIQSSHEIIKNFKSNNVAGFLKAKKSDSFIVFTAHYDHLGKQGNAVFPGASDNASGTSLVLYLAEYFSKQKIKHNIAFILFSGEEVGLLGSDYFIKNPLFDLKKIKMVINLDIMGNAENGITVVNGEVHKEKFNQLLNINIKKKYLPEIKARGESRNSDHYPFHAKGIPAFFIYSNGGKGFYHDVFDTAESISLYNFDKVARLLIDFTTIL